MKRITSRSLLFLTALLVCAGHRVLTFDEEQVAPSDYVAFRQALTEPAEYAERVLLLRR